VRKETATRQNLIRLKRRHEAVSRGKELLKSKREALMKEFMGLVDECVKSRKTLSTLLVRGVRGMETARAVNPEAIESLSIALKREVALDFTLKNVWGVKIPEFARKQVVRSLDAMESSAIGESVASLDVVKTFERAVEAMIGLATPEARLNRVGESIKADTRRINAMEEILLPRMTAGVRSIERALEEREKEDVYRLKRFKARRRG
jgi:V/A-type H+-transporting ATPase subunit D